jgi:hypothetical protein
MLRINMLRAAELLPLVCAPKHHILAPDESSNLVPISLQMGCVFVAVDEPPPEGRDTCWADAASGKLAKRARASIKATVLLRARNRLIFQTSPELFLFCVVSLAPGNLWTTCSDAEAQPIIESRHDTERNQ